MMPGESARRDGFLFGKGCGDSEGKGGSVMTRAELQSSRRFHLGRALPTGAKSVQKTPYSSLSQINTAEAGNK
jgi:hypothetical protein